MLFLEMAGRAALLCSLLAMFNARVAGEMLSWPECPCPNLTGYGTCTRVHARQVQDNTNDLNVNLQSCKIGELTPSDFNYPNARWVDLRFNYIPEIDADVFKHLTNVKYLSLEKNKFTGKRIDHKAFQKCSLLRGIGLNGNDMREAPNDLVQGLRYLEELHLMDTSLFEVPFFVKQAPNLTHLYLGFNQITLSDPDTFSTLPKLKFLYLDRNLIEFIPENIFQPASGLKTIYLNNNKLTFIPDNLFANLDNLQHLRLQNNAIQYISEYAFRDISNLDELDISNNRLTQLSSNFLARLSQPKKFFFSGNPWECDFFKKFLNHVEERHIVHNDNQVHYVCYKCLDFPFTYCVHKARTPVITKSSVGQWDVTSLDYCHQ